MSRTIRHMYISYTEFTGMRRNIKQTPGGYGDAALPFPEELSAEEKERFLDCVRQVADAPLPKLRAILGMSRTRMGEVFAVPVGTLKGWEAGRRTAPEYFCSLVAYIAFLHLLNAVPGNAKRRQEETGPWSSEDLYPISPEALFRRLSEEMENMKENFI